MDLEFTAEQAILRETVRGLCEKHASIEVVRQLENDPVGYPPEMWAKLGDLGLVGLRFPERYGGSAQGILDAVVLYEELGRALVPVPHFASAILAAGVLQRAGSPEQQETWLGPMASGETIVVPAWLESGGGFGPRGVGLEARALDEGFALTGVKTQVPFAQAAQGLLVLARAGEAPEDISLFLVDPRSSGVTLRQQKTMACDTQFEVTFDAVRVAERDRVGGAGAGWAIWTDMLYEGVILLAAQAMGGARRALEMTVAYAKEREQFGKPLGAFQSLAHYMADAATSIDGGTTLVHQAAWTHDQGASIRRLAPMAKAFACRTFRETTKVAQQIHGGMGFSVEYDIQLYFRRAKQLELSWWDQAFAEELIAADGLDSADAPDSGASTG